MDIFVGGHSGETKDGGFGKEVLFCPFIWVLLAWIEVGQQRKSHTAVAWSLGQDSSHLQGSLGLV